MITSIKSDALFIHVALLERVEEGPLFVIRDRFLSAHKDVRSTESTYRLTYNECQYYYPGLVEAWKQAGSPTQ